MRPSNKKNGRKKRSNRPNRVELISHPPPLGNKVLQWNTTMRFLCTGSAFDGNITFQNLLNTILLAQTAVQGNQIFQAVRVRYVEAWHCPVASTVSLIIIEYAGNTAGLVGDQKVHEDSSMGIQPAHVRAKPAARSLAGYFQDQSASVAFRLACPVGTVVDVGLEFVGQYNGIATVANALVGATVGAIYLRGLDGQPLASTQFLPQVPNAWIR
jgi:hypothetical protein